MDEPLARKWLANLGRLNPASGRNPCRGKAPHKPLLLLSLLDMVEAGELMNATITRTPGLVLRFNVDLWSVADNETVLVAHQRFTESGPADLRLTPYRGRSLQFAPGVSLCPNPEFFRRHREHHKPAGAG